MPPAELALGCWQFAGTFGFWNNQTREDSIRTIHAALRGGVRHFDTAQGYGNGRSEQMLGQQLRRFRFEYPRETLTIATKVMPLPPSKLREAVATSLRRLCTPYIDILYLHWPDSQTDMRPLLEAMLPLKEAGLIHAIGISNFPLPLARQICTSIPIDWMQRAVSLIWIQDFLQTKEFCQTQGIRLAAYSPLGMGLLSGRYRTAEDLPEGDARKNLFCFRGESKRSWNNVLDILSACSRQIGCTSSQLALAWTLSQDLSVVISGVRTKSQLTENLTAEQLYIPSDTLNRLSEAALQLARTIPAGQDNIFGHIW